VDGLKELRLQQHLTRRILAARVGVSKQTLQLWEGGTLQPSPRHIPRLAEALGVDPARLPAMLRASATEMRRRALPPWSVSREEMMALSGPRR
jgi:transcriptional regulator with XRE-family HTH domain